MESSEIELPIFWWVEPDHQEKEKLVRIEVWNLYVLIAIRTCIASRKQSFQVRSRAGTGRLDKASEEAEHGPDRAERVLDVVIDRWIFMGFKNKNGLIDVFSAVRVCVLEQTGDAYCRWAWGRVLDRIGIWFAPMDSSRRDLKFDILIVFWFLTVWEIEHFEVAPELGFMSKLAARTVSEFDGASEIGLECGLHWWIRLFEMFNLLYYIFFDFVLFECMNAFYFFFS